MTQYRQRVLDLESKLLTCAAKSFKNRCLRKSWDKLYERVLDQYEAETWQPPYDDDREQDPGY